jgi:aryl-alcohol dehydrogenase-like predicted oxidoreductase
VTPARDVPPASKRAKRVAKDEPKSTGPSIPSSAQGPRSGLDWDRDALPLGGTGRSHPPLGLGLWALGRWEHEDELRTRSATERALARGLPWVDTAEVYGQGRSERILGEVLARLAPGSSGPFVTTKVSWEHLRPEQLRASAEGSFRRIGRPIDLYLVHAPDPRVPLRETMAALEALQNQGRVRAVGVSNFSVDEMVEARAALRSTDVVANQVRYNLFEREDGDAVLDYCRRERIVVEAYTPLARGLLAGRFLDGVPPGRGDPRGRRGTFGSEKFPTYVQRARALSNLAREAGVPMASLALHWLRRKGVAPVFGARDPDQVDAVLDAWAHRPPDEALARAERIASGV